MESPSLEIFKGHQNRWKDRMLSVHYLKFPDRSSVFPLTLISNDVETLKFLCQPSKVTWYHKASVHTRLKTLQSVENVLEISFCHYKGLHYKDQVINANDSLGN